MRVFRQPLPPRPTPATRTPFAALALALAVAGPALAQPSRPSALVAADPQTPSAPVAATPAPVPDAGPAPEWPTDIERARAIWQQVNQRVAAFPRGHIDLLRWETRNASATPAPAPAAASPLDFPTALRDSLRLRPGLFAHPTLNELERNRVQRAYAEHVRELHRAWAEAVTARQSLRLTGESLEAAATGAELGRRMAQAGNWSQARLQREQLVEAQARQDWRRTAQAQTAAVERLARLLGIWDATAVAQLLARLPDELPEPPAQPSPGTGLLPADVESAAIRSLPALAQQRLRTQRALEAVSAERRAAWDQATAAALQDAPTWTAPQLGDLRLARDHTLEAAVQAESALLLAATERRSMAREAWSQLQTQHASARHAQDVVLSLQTAQQQETLLRYNGMLQSSWDLLASARERLAALHDAVQARRDFWLAQADWDALLAGADYVAAGAPSGSDNNNRAAAGGH